MQCIAGSFEPCIVSSSDNKATPFLPVMKIMSLAESVQ